MRTVSLKELGHAFGSKQLFKNVNATFAKGSSYALVGPSGCGKSTLLSIIAGMQAPTQGAVLIDDFNLYAQSSEALADYRLQQVGMVFQQAMLLPELNVVENVMLKGLLAGKEATHLREQAERLLADVGLVEYAAAPIAALSGGQQHRIAIARALMMQPSLVIADEPTAHLDHATALMIMQLLFSLCEQSAITLILATHNEEVARGCEHVVYVQDGMLKKGLECVSL
jgi:ABC-type lipoprotein export system ATPase subunit